VTAGNCAKLQSEDDARPYASSLLRGAESVSEKDDPVAIAALPVFLLL
jgi:hypothetical protein